MTFKHDRKFFDATDLAIFITTLTIPILIGFYYGCISKKKQTTVCEYLLGSRNMKLFPISMSLSASYISGYNLIGPMSEVYFYGIQFLLQSISLSATFICFALVYLPVFHNLKITSTYEYLEMRFDYKVRLLGSFLFVIKTLINMAIWLYAPIIMFDQVIGLHLNTIIPIFSGICVFYTTFGGVRAVIWADTFQMILMLLGMITVMIIGTYDIGGIEEIWQINKQGGRLQILDFNPDPRVRQSFWIFVVGYSFSLISYLTASQFVIQRCASLPALSKAKIAVYITLVVALVIIFQGSYVGLMLYAAFHDCDPITSQEISQPDQLLPYFIMNLKNKIPGLPSVIISIVFCAALSSVSSGLNSISGIVLIDFIRPFSKKPVTDAQGSLYMKIIGVLSGIVYTGITYSLNNGNSIFQSTMNLISISIGPSFGIFTLGVLFPWANAMGAFIGGIAGVVMVAWMSTGAQIAVAAGQLVYPKLPLSVDNCINSTVINFGNETLKLSLKIDAGEPFFLYSISFFYYPMIGACTTVIVGMIVSYFTGLNKPKEMDPRLFSPAIQKYIRKDETTVEMATNQSR